MHSYFHFFRLQSLCTTPYWKYDGYTWKKCYTQLNTCINNTKSQLRRAKCFNDSIQCNTTLKIFISIFILCIVMYVSIIWTANMFRVTIISKQGINLSSDVKNQRQLPVFTQTSDSGTTYIPIFNLNTFEIDFIQLTGLNLPVTTSRFPSFLRCFNRWTLLCYCFFPFFCSNLCFCHGCFRGDGSRLFGGSFYTASVH